MEEIVEDIALGIVSSIIGSGSKEKKNKKKWDPKTSKWKAAIEKGLKINLDGGENILYLGASSGTTVEQLSERTKGKIYAVEKSNVMAIPLVKLSENKENIFPLFSDARDIDYIKEKIENEKIDILFCDIPSNDQVTVLANASTLVEDECRIYFSLKTQSISQEKPDIVKDRIKKELGKYFTILNEISLEPFHRKHYFFVLEKK